MFEVGFIGGFLIGGIVYSALWIYIIWRSGKT